MVLGAIVVVGAECGAHRPEIRSVIHRPDSTEPLLPPSLQCAEMLGRSLVEHIVERFLAATVEVVTVLVHSSLSAQLPAFRGAFESVTVLASGDLEASINEALKQHADEGVDYTFVTDASTYTECDFIDLLWFHRGSQRTVTRTFDRGGPLNLWLATGSKLEDGGREFLAPAVEAGSEGYFISDYVSRLAHPHDMRRLAENALRGRCEIRPQGQEVRPGVWVDEGAHLHKRARIVAPAYIGVGSVIREDTVVTRCSNIESHCYIDYGTVIEDSSILTNSYVGIWLDVTHAVVEGRRLWNLPRNVGLEIADASVIRQNVASPREGGGNLHRIGDPTARWLTAAHSD